MKVKNLCKTNSEDSRKFSKKPKDNRDNPKIAELLMSIYML